jgi:hypothetical protein
VSGRATLVSDTDKRAEAHRAMTKEALGRVMRAHMPAWERLALADRLDVVCALGERWVREAEEARHAHLLDAGSLRLDALSVLAGRVGAELADDSVRGRAQVASGAAD